MESRTNPKCVPNGSQNGCPNGSWTLRESTLRKRSLKALLESIPQDCCWRVLPESPLREYSERRHLEAIWCQNRPQNGPPKWIPRSTPKGTPKRAQIDVKNILNVSPRRWGRRSKRAAKVAPKTSSAWKKVEEVGSPGLVKPWLPLAK